MRIADQTRFSMLLAGVLGLGLLSVALPAAAQMGPPNPDLNRDGMVTLSEYKTSQANSLFGQMDKDKDQRLTRQEFKSLEDLARRFGGAKGTAFAAYILNQSDQNRDGVITVPELDTASTKRFQSADANRDGWLSKAELKAMRQASQAAIGQQSP